MQQKMSAIRISAAAAIVISCLNVSGLSAQPAPAVSPEFEVASIRPHPSSDGSPQVSMAGGHGRITYTAVTVRGLIRKAYGLRVYPLSPGASDQLSADRYDIDARGSGNASEEQTMRMLQALLAERFRLAVHRQTKELPGYALLPGRNGPKLREVKDDGSDAEIRGGEGHPIMAHHVPMKLLANRLAGYIGAPVVDATGLRGLFDFTLDFSADESLSDDRTPGPTIFEAVQWQLGLKLEARKEPAEVIVVDHVEKPSVN